MIETNDFELLQNYCNENCPKSESRKFLKVPDLFIPLLKLNGFDLVMTIILQNYAKIDVQPPEMNGQRIAFSTILNIDDTNNLLTYYAKN